MSHKSFRYWVQSRKRGPKRLQSELLECTDEIQPTSAHLWSPDSRIAVSETKVWFNRETEKTMSCYGPYHLFRTWHDFYTYYRANPSKRGFNALSTISWGPVRFYLDYDCKFENVCEESTHVRAVRVATDLCALVTQFFKLSYPKYDSNMDLWVTDACRPHKNSVHIHSSTHFWDDLSQLKAFVTNFQTFVHEQILAGNQCAVRVGDHIDMAPYSKKQNFRMTFQSKPQKEAKILQPLGIWDGNALRLIGSDQTDVEKWLQVSVPHFRIPGSNEVRVPSTLLSAHTKHIMRSKHQHDTANEVEFLSLKDESFLAWLLSDVEHFPNTERAFESDVIALSCDTRIIDFKSCVDTVCCIHSGLQHPEDDGGKSHLLVRHDNFSSLLYIQTGCHRSKCKEMRKGKKCNFTINRGLKVILTDEKHEKYELKNNEAKLFTHFRESLFSGTDELTEIQVDFPVSLFTPDEKVYETYHNRYVEKIIFDQQIKTIALRSECGTGKSKASVMSAFACIADKPKCSAEPEHYGIVVLPHRKALAHTIHNAFTTKAGTDTEFKVHSYLDFEKKSDIRSCENIIVSLDSSRHLLQPDGELRTPYVLWVDEASACLAHLAISPTLAGNRRTTLQIFEQLHKQAECVLWTDADLGDHDLEILRKLRSPDTMKVIHNTYPGCSDKTYIWISSLDMGVIQLIDIMKKNEKAFITCDSKQEAQQIHASLSAYGGDIKIRYYDGNCTDELRNEWRTCETEWVKWDFIITTCCIDVGVDFSPAEPYFNHVFGFFRKETVNYNCAFQMMQRVRKLKQGGCTYVCMNFGYTSSEFASFTDIKHQVIKMCNEFTMPSVISNEQRETMDRKFINNKLQCDETSAFFLAYTNTLYVNSMSRGNFATFLAARICASGAKLLLMPIKTMTETGVDKSSTVNEIKNIRYETQQKLKLNATQRIFTAHDLDEDELKTIDKKLQQSTQLTEPEQASLDKLRIRNTYKRTKDETLTFEFIKKYGDKWQLERFANFKRFACSSEDYDKEQVTKVCDGTISLIDAAEWRMKTCAIEELAKILDIEIGKSSPICEDEVDQKADFGAKVSMWQLLFPKAFARWTKKKKKTRTAIATTWISMWNTLFPTMCSLVVATRKRGKSEDGQKIRKRSYILKWNMAFWLDVLERIRSVKVGRSLRSLSNDCLRNKHTTSPSDTCMHAGCIVKRENVSNISPYKQWTVIDNTVKTAPEESESKCESETEPKCKRGSKRVRESNGGVEIDSDNDQ